MQVARHSGRRPAAELGFTFASDDVGRYLVAGPAPPAPAGYVPPAPRNPLHFDSAGVLRDMETGRPRKQWRHSRIHYELPTTRLKYTTKYYELPTALCNRFVRHIFSGSQSKRNGLRG